jgi:DNA-binding transcriptional LysR family regulator
MKIQHLRFFCAVIECRSVTAAAERLHISQPTISAGIKALQDGLGEPLFDRSGGKRRIFPTTAALRFYDDAKEILARCETAVAAFSKPVPKSDAIRVGILNTIACGDVAAVLAQAMLSSDPVWKVREGSASDIGRWLAHGQIDIAWTTIEKSSRTSAVLWSETFAVLTARHHRLAQRPIRTVKVTDLSGEPIVLRTSCELRSGKLQASGIKFRVVARASRDDLALRMVAQGIGLAIAPRSFATPDVIAMPFTDIEMTRDIGLRWRPEVPDAFVSKVNETVMLFGKPAALTT